MIRHTSLAKEVRNFATIRLSRSPKLSCTRLVPTGALERPCVPDLFLRGLLSDHVFQRLIKTVQELNEATVDEVAAVDEG